ncbi:glycosyltransferase family 4 protein [Romboutsia timonensis]|uniref:glycosyltransferase family 4 protein n=1 Tax=Romboutsia timonensis TaxID=1776391 RepID=UPI002A837093|nr:glycosyltransferase family 4 protein [Romboutsia timonensis]MDY3959627.1 glycosyltransferase family 4 protein [Romboutsia timonensis]
MNILYINNSMHLGGDNKCILKLCKQLKDNNKIIIASKGGVLESELTNLGIKHYYIKDVVNKMPHVILSNIRTLVKIVKDENIDIIHSHHRMATLTAKIVSKFTGVRVIHTQHLCIEDKFKLTNLALSNVQIITVSNAAKEILKNKSGLNEENITTIYNTVETENKNKVVDKKLIDLKDKGYFIIAQVSRVIDYKGIYDFVDVAEEVVKENDKIRFVLIGDGPEKENLEKYINEKILKEYIYLLGSKNNVIEHLKYVDLLLLCSYIEGLPLAPLEAFSQGIPVIATNIDGTNEEIINGYNGYLVEKKDIEGFKTKINQIYRDKELLDKLKENSFKIYSEKFDEKQYREKHIEIYKKILKED